jgi:hypothetical protein
LTKLFESFKPYEYLLQTSIRVWFDTEVSDDGRHSVGHSKAYIKVLVPFDPSLPGKNRIVNIQSCHRFHVEGVISETTTKECSSTFYPSFAMNSLAIGVGIIGILGIIAIVKYRKR